MERKTAPEIAITSLDEFKKFVDSMEVEVYYEMPKSFKYQRMSIDNEKADGYSWTMERNYKVMGAVGYVFPMKNNNYVQTFKTLAGAKRSLVKHCEWIFERH